MTLRRPIVTPLVTTTCAPSQTLSPMPDRTLRREALPRHRGAEVLEAVVAVGDHAAVRRHAVLADLHAFDRGDHDPEIDQACRRRCEMRPVSDVSHTPGSKYACGPISRRPSRSIPRALPCIGPRANAWRRASSACSAKRFHGRRERWYQRHFCRQQPRTGTDGSRTGTGLGDMDAILTPVRAGWHPCPPRETLVRVDRHEHAAAAEPDRTHLAATAAALPGPTDTSRRREFPPAGPAEPARSAQPVRRAGPPAGYAGQPGPAPARASRAVQTSVWILGLVSLLGSGPRALAPGERTRTNGAPSMPGAGSPSRARCSPWPRRRGGVAGT